MWVVRMVVMLVVVILVTTAMAVAVAVTASGPMLLHRKVVSGCGLKPRLVDLNLHARMHARMPTLSKPAWQLHARQGVHGHAQRHAWARKGLAKRPIPTSTVSAGPPW